MKHKAFTEIVAHSTLVPEKTVAMFGRNLKSAGLLTSGARGVNAPEMTSLDLARILIAVCATDRPSDAVGEVNWYRALHCSEGGNATVTMSKFKDGASIDEKVDLFEIEEGSTLEDIMAWVFGAPPFITAVLHMQFEIVVPHRVAFLTLGDLRLSFRNPEFMEEMDSNGGLSRGIRTTRMLANHALTEMALPFGLEQAEDATWEAMTAEEGGPARAANRHIFGVKDDGGADG